jgi:hypothetical protein
MKNARGWGLAGALAGALLLFGPASAQEAQQDPFNGQFGSLEIAFPAREASHQAQLMNQAISSLQPQTPGHQDVYLIVASLWGEPVFESEATQAKEILEAHLGAQGHTILLSAGSNGGPRNLPAATPQNISAAIGRVGELIDPNEDLVVVFLTSHGRPNGAMAMLEQNRLQADLRPVNLRDMLDNAGIKNRVVIISACFSGAFIAPLMNNDTVIMAAAAPDRTSFGCQPEREWTFFGDAYFNHALRNGAAMIPAFDQAKALITQWETEQHLTPPSNPQRFIGPHAAQMLAAAEHAAASSAPH